MAQYDIVFIKNDSVSGVSYSEHKLAKPPVSGFSLTQDPTSGLLSWAQSMNLIGTVTGSFNYNDLQTTGYYYISPSSVPSQASAPKYNNGVLQVHKVGDFISQMLHCYTNNVNVNPQVFLRQYNPILSAWSNWTGIDTNYTAPTRPPQDTRSPYSEGAETISGAVTLLENAIMEHTFNHIIEDSVNIRAGWWIINPNGNYEIDVPFDGLTPDSIIDVSPIIASTSVAEEAEILPFILIGTDSFKVTARNQPTDDIDCVIRIYKK